MPPTGTGGPGGAPTDDAEARHRLRRRALLSAAGAAGATFLAGCTGGSGGGSGGSGGENPATRYLATDITSNPSTFDPHAVTTDSNQSWMIRPPNAYETLVFYAEESSELVPALASEVPSVDNGLITNDGTTFEFPLREGVTFHTGEEMLAQDWKFSLERVTTMGISDELQIHDILERIEVADDYRLRLTLAEPFAAFLPGTIPRTSFTVVSQQAVEDNGGVQEGQPNQWLAQNTAGTGPYYLDEWERGAHAIWEYHEDYWDPDSVGPRGVFQRVTPEVSTSVSLMDRGRIHTTRYELAEIDSFEDTGAEFDFYSSLAQTFFFFNYDIPYDRDNMPDDDTVPSDFWQDPDVRKAWAYSIDYEEYIAQAWNGHGFLSNQPCHLEPLLYYDDSAPNFEYDPEKAEELWKATGYWDEGFTYTMMTETVGEFEAAILLIKDQLESLNDRFTINTQAFAEAEYVARREEDPWSFTSDIGGFPAFGPDPAPYYEQLMLGPPSQGTRMADHVDPRIIELTREGSRTLDRDRRQEIYSELQRLCVDDPPHLSLNAEQLVTIYNPCATPSSNAAYEQEAAKHWDISGCGDLDIQL